MILIAVSLHCRVVSNDDLRNDDNDLARPLLQKSGHETIPHLLVSTSKLKPLTNDGKYSHVSFINSARPNLKLKSQESSLILYQTIPWRR